MKSEALHRHVDSSIGGSELLPNRLVLRADVDLSRHASPDWRWVSAMEMISVPVLLTVFVPQTHVLPPHSLELVSWHIRGYRSRDIPVLYGIVMGVENNILLPVLLPVHISRAFGPRVLLPIFFPSEVDLWAVFSIRTPLDMLLVERGHVVSTRSWYIRVFCDSQPRSYGRGCVCTYHFGHQGQLFPPLRRLSVEV